MAAPEGTPSSGVIVIMEAYGVTDHIKEVCERLAGAGHLAVAPHFFHRSGDAVIAYDDKDAVWPPINALKYEELVDDIAGAISYFEGQGISQDHVGVIGFCLGGSVSFIAAARFALGAAVTFYGGGISEARFTLPALLDLVPELQSPWLGQFGDNDPSIPVDDVEKLRAAVSATAVETEIVRYPDAGHGFHCDARPEAYHEESAKAAWQRAEAWLSQLQTA